MQRVLLSKAEGLLRLVYPALSMLIQRHVQPLIPSYSSSFGKTEYVRRKTITRVYSEGGYNAWDFNTVNNTFKVNWLKQCVHQWSVTWFYIPNVLFEQCGSLQFLLSCHFKWSKLPVKFANFYKQALDAWKLAFNHIF